MDFSKAMDAIAKAFKDDLVKSFNRASVLSRLFHEPPLQGARVRFLPKGWELQRAYGETDEQLRERILRRK